MHDFRSYLGGRYGDPDRFDSKQEIEEATVGRVGIIAFGLMHIDVWSKDNIHRPSEFNLGYLWNSGHWEGEKLMFWDLPPPGGRHIEYQSAR